MYPRYMEPKPRRALPIAAIVTFLGFIDTNLLIPIIALYASELGASIGTVGLIVGLYSLTHTPANLVFGQLIDRIGYKFPLVAGLIGDALSMFLYSVSWLPVHLALVRALHGITGASVGPATMSIIAGYSERKQKGRSMSFYGIAIGTATLVGFGLSGVIARGLGIKAVFWLGTALLAIGAVLSVVLPGGRKHVEGKVRMSAEGLKKVQDLFRRKGLLVAYCAIFAHYISFGSVVTLLPLRVKSLGMDALHVGVLLAIFSITFILLQFISGSLSDRVGRVIPTASGLSLGIVSLIVMPLAASFPPLAMVMVLYGLAFGLLFPAVSALVTDHAAPEEVGMATGMFHALLTTGVAVGAPLMGWVGGVLGVESGLALSSVFMGLALVIVLGLARKV